MTFLSELGLELIEIDGQELCFLLLFLLELGSSPLLCILDAAIARWPLSWLMLILFRRMGHLRALSAAIRAFSVAGTPATHRTIHLCLRSGDGWTPSTNFELITATLVFPDAKRLL